MSIIKTLIWLTLFSIAMGFLETAVVVYLRELYYPDGFTFPVKPTSETVLITELWRELATIVMLAGIGILSGRNFAERFVYFLYSFAIWDLFYYVFLKLLLNWPATLLDWDILFLLPVPWIGPVLAPCILSLSMIVLTIIVVFHHSHKRWVRIKPLDWILLTTGSLIIVASFCNDYVSIITGKKDNPNIILALKKFIPYRYEWWQFTLGEVMILLAIYLIYQRTFKKAEPLVN